MTNNTDTPNTDTPQVPVSPLPARGLLEQFLVFINTPIGVWLLTSGFIGLIVWQYQQHQQYMQERAVRMQTIAHLNAEITGRISQFGTWARNNLIQSSNTYSFKQGITETTVIDAIKGLDSVPGKDNKVGIAFGLFPENSQQTLFALYIELNIRTSEQKEFGDDGLCTSDRCF